MLVKIKRITVLFMAFILLLTCFVGCGNQSNEPQDETPSILSTTYESSTSITADFKGLYLDDVNSSGLNYDLSYNRSFINNLSSYKEVIYGLLVVPESYISENKASHKFLDENMIDINISSFDTQDTVKNFVGVNVVISNPNNYYQDYVGMAYIRATTEKGTCRYIYSKASDSVNLYKLAKQAYINQSDYSSSQLTVIKSFIDPIVEVETKADGSLCIVNSLIDYGYTIPEGRSISFNADNLQGLITKLDNDIVCGVCLDNKMIDVSISGNSITFSYELAASIRETKMVYSYSFDCIGGTDVMPIVGFGGFDWASVKNYPDSVTTNTEDNGAVWNYWASEYKTLGINTVVHSIAGIDYASTLKTLTDICSSNDIAYYLSSGNLNSYFQGSSLDNDKWQAIYNTINGNISSSNFVGVMTKDEPWTNSEIDRMAVAQNNILSNCASAMSSRSFYSNLLPFRTSVFTVNSIPNKQNYFQYLNYYCNVLSPKFLSFDLYPYRALSASGETDYIAVQDYITNLSYMNEFAYSKGLPFWSYIQCGCDWNDDGDANKKPANSWKSRPTQQEFRWLVNVTLAYGAKGIEYYELNQNTVNVNSQNGEKNYSRNGIFGYNGQKNEWYDYAFEANNNIKAIDEYLMNATQEGIMVGSSSSYASNYIPISDRLTSYYELSSVNGKALVGCFNYMGKTALYVVYDDGITDQKGVADTSDGVITLNFNGSYDYTMIKGASSTNSTIGSNKAITLSNLKPGEGVLIVLN